MSSNQLDKRVVVSTIGCSAVVATEIEECFFEETYGSDVGEITVDKTCESIILIA